MKTKLQQRHARQSELPEAFALATLAAAVRPARTEGQRKAAKAAQRKALRLIERGELVVGREESPWANCT